MFSRNIIVSNDPKLNDSWISVINYDIYTWREIETYVINKQINFYRIFRNIAVLIAIGILDSALIKGENEVSNYCLNRFYLS